MRLLNVHSEEFSNFLGNDVPNYSIASHRWVQDECSIKDILKRRNLESAGYKKVNGFCAFVRQANDLYKDTHPELMCDYLWIDTCCIDQKSSLEVDTAIRSMFQWYNKSVVCYAYLADVEPISAGREMVEASLTKSVWFSRGWTLQELLAPRTVVFLTRDWEVIGHKCTCTAITDGGECPGSGPRLNGMIAEITGIPELVLYDYPRSKELTIEERMSWSAKRKTTRQEDMVYCLLGIFEIHMPVMYGEGEFAQVRLRNEIEKKTEAWQKGQKAGVQAHYNTRAPCASSSSSRSHLPTISQSAPQRLPPPVPGDNEPNIDSVEASQDTNDPESDRVSGATLQNNLNSHLQNVKAPQRWKHRVGADDLLDELGDVHINSRDEAADRSSVDATVHAGQNEFGPPIRNRTFNSLHEPYGRHGSAQSAARTSIWGPGGRQIIEEDDESLADQPSHDSTLPTRPPPPAGVTTAASHPSSLASANTQENVLEPSDRDRVPAPPISRLESNNDAGPPPPPSYESIWESNQQRGPQHTDTFSAPTKSPTWYESNSDHIKHAPLRSATWNTSNSDSAGTSRNPLWRPSPSDYINPTLEDTRAPNRQATASSISGSTVNDVHSQLSKKAQRKLESTIAKEERRSKRRERLFNRKHGISSASTSAGMQEAASPIDDLYDSEEDDISIANSGVTYAAEQPSYSSGGDVTAPSLQQHNSSTNARIYDVVQDVRRQDARRRFFENAVIDEEPRSGNSSADVSRPPPPSRTRTNERSLSDIADALPSGLKLTKSALRLLDSKTGGASPSGANSEHRDVFGDDQRTVIASDSGTARSKPMGRKELKEVLMSQRGSDGQDNIGRRLSPRDRLLNAVSSHLRNSGT